MQLAANWPDKQTSKSSVILSDQAGSPEVRVTDCKQSNRAAVETKRENSPIGKKKRSDSPNPEKILLAIQCFKKGLTWKEIVISTDVPERTLRRYLKELGYQRDYKFVSEKLLGKNKTKEHIKKISLVRIAKGVAKGEKNPNWKGGIQSEWNKLWQSQEYRLWRESVFKRDGYICKGCGIKNGKGLGKTIRLNAHHILPRRDFPHLILSLSNGITLCEECHDKTINKEYLSVNIWKQRVV